MTQTTHPIGMQYEIVEKYSAENVMRNQWDMSTSSRNHYTHSKQRDMLQDAVSFNAVLEQYDERLTSIIYTKTFRKDQVRILFPF